MSETEAMAHSLLPMIQGDGGTGKRAEYLAKRVANFSMRESCKLAGVTEKSVHRWREADANFNYLDTEGLTELRKSLGAELLNMEFTRNFHLVLEKDFKILYKDAVSETPGAIPLTEDEKIYLLKIRQHYTPQSLAMVKQLLGGGTVEAPFNFTDFIFTLKREKVTEQIQIKGV